MKKRTALILALIALVAVFAMSVSAATPSERIIEAMEAIPAFTETHVIKAENGLANIEACGEEITDADADAIVAAIEKLDAEYGAPVNYDFDKLSADELAAMLEIMNEAAATVNCTVKYAEDDDDIWEIIVYHQHADSEHVVDTVTNEEVKPTGVNGTALVVAISVIVLAAAASVVIFRKKSQMNAA